VAALVIAGVGLQCEQTGTDHTLSVKWNAVNEMYPYNLDNLRVVLYSRSSRDMQVWPTRLFPA